MADQKIHQSMVAVMRDLTAISKSKRNQQQGFLYRGIDDLYNAVHSVMAKHGVFTTPEVLNKHREERTTQRGSVLIYTMLRMRYTFWADDGSSVSCVVEGEGMDSGDKSSNKAMAIAHKYALLQTFCIPTEDMIDPDSETHAVAPQKDETAELEENIKTAETDIGKNTSMEALKRDFARWYQWAKPLGDGPVSRIKGAYEKRKRELAKEDAA